MVNNLEQKIDKMLFLLEEILEELRKPTKDSKKRWLSPKELGEELRISERTIYRLRKDGVFKEGKDFRRKFPDNPKSSLIYNLESCDKAYFMVISGRRLEIST